MAILYFKHVFPNPTSFVVGTDFGRKYRSLEGGRGSGHVWSKAEAPLTPAPLSPWVEALTPGTCGGARSLLAVPSPLTSTRGWGDRGHQHLPPGRGRGDPGPHTPNGRARPGNCARSGSHGQGDGCYPSVTFVNDPRLEFPSCDSGALGLKKFVLSVSWLP